MFQDSVYTRLKIDGTQFMGYSFQTDMKSDAVFSVSSVRDCRDYLKKTGFRPRIHGKDVPVPCIYISTYGGSYVTIYGFAEEGIQEILISDEPFAKGSVYQLFYDNFFVK